MLQLNKKKIMSLFSSLDYDDIISILNISDTATTSQLYLPLATGFALLIFTLFIWKYQNKITIGSIVVLLLSLFVFLYYLVLDVCH